MTVIMKCKDISKEYGDKVILKNINLDLKLGEKVGIVGENGAGKTTLVNIITGNSVATSGEVIWYKEGIKVGYMKQATDYTNLQSSLSGGERTKALLKSIIYGDFNLLILDEPTNHLDYEGVSWLIKKVNEFKGTIIIISHDRYFLDKTVNKVIEIEDKEVKIYNGNYTAYRDKKKKNFQAQMHAYIEQEKVKEKINNQIAELKKWSNKAHKEAGKKAIETGNKSGGKQFNRAKAKKMDAQVKSKIKRLQKLQVEGVDKPKEEGYIVFNGTSAGKIGSVVLEAKDISKAYDNKVLFNKSSFYIKQGEKVGVYGPNGCGKTTLIKAILGQEEIEGEINISSSRKIGYISQDVLDINEEISIIEAFKINSRKELGKLRSDLALIGFDAESLNKKIKYLSLGERMKIKLLLLIRESYEVLILDEPTNHIDLHVREQLESVLEKYNGTIILVTHDRYMMEKICDKLLVFDNKEIKRYEYNFNEYLEKINEKNEKKNMNRAEENLIIDNRITCIISELSMINKDSVRYKELEKQYNELIKIRQDYN